MNLSPKNRGYSWRPSATFMSSTAEASSVLGSAWSRDTRPDRREDASGRIRPERFGNLFFPPHKDSQEVHLHQRLFAEASRPLYRSMIAVSNSRHSRFGPVAQRNE